MGTVPEDEDVVVEKEVEAVVSDEVVEVKDTVEGEEEKVLEPATDTTIDEDAASTDREPSAEPVTLYVVVLTAEIVS